MARSNLDVSLLEPNSFDSNNRIADAGWLYDSAGNVKKNPLNQTFVYDGENRMAAYCTQDPGECVNTSGSGRTLYWYAGDGRRVKKADAGSTTIFVYNAMGQLAAEYSDLAPSGSGTSYLTTDHLGSTRVITDAAGAVKKRYDYLPFGEEISPAVGGRTTALGYSTIDATRQLFTGKERDAESGLDYFGARYFSGAQGRFTSPDSLLIKKEWLADPQRLNHYAYVRNNPLKYIDPNGEDLIIYVSFGQDLTEEQKEYLQQNMAKIQAAIADKFKKAGVKNVVFREGSQLTVAQQHTIEYIGRRDQGIGQLYFVNQSFANIRSKEDWSGATTNKNQSIVFLGNLESSLKLPEQEATLNFRASEVGAHELGHGQRFDADLPSINFIKEVFRLGNLMGEGQGMPMRPKQFDPTQDKTRRAIEEINRIGDRTPKP